MSERAPNRLPWWLKGAYTLWLLVLVPADLLFFGPWQYLWFCHLGNLLLAVALWRESALIFSWQAVSLLLLDGYFTLDVLGRLLLGFHPIGGTEYIFDTVNYPFHIRAMAFFHMGVPVLLLYGVWRLGYDRRACGSRCFLPGWSCSFATFFRRRPWTSIGYLDRMTVRKHWYRRGFTCSLS